jgi:hypothetical protein
MNRIRVFAGGYKDSEALGIAELHHYLPAHTAGIGITRLTVPGPACDGNGFKIPFSFRNSLGKGGTFGTDSRTIGGVFDVATPVNFSVLAE